MALSTRRIPLKLIPAIMLGHITSGRIPILRRNDAQAGESRPATPQIQVTAVRCHNSPSRTVFSTTQLSGHSARKAPRPTL